MIHAFYDGKYYIALDIESGSIHLIDELVYDLLEAQEKGNNAAWHALLNKHGESAVMEAKTELDELEKKEEWNTPRQAYVPFKGEPVVKALCLHVAHDCNLRCQYCFADDGEYRGGRAIMPLRVGQKALDFLMQKSGKRKHLEVDFFGGEPLMNLDVVKELVAYGRKLEKQYDKQINFTITTNGLLIDDDFVDFCDREIYNVVLSLDGRKEIHDAVRKTVSGKGSFDAILDKAKKLAFARQNAGQSYYVRGTFTRQNLDFAKDVLFLADEGFEQISIEPVVLPSDDPLALQEEDLPVIHDEYAKLAKAYIERRKDADTWFNFFHFMLDFDEGPCLAKRMGGCGAGSEYLAITPQGDIYPCHQFVGQEEFKMGNVLTEELNNISQESFRACNIVSKEPCGNCWAKYYCSGGCAANAMNFNKDLYKPYELACEMQKSRVEQAISIHIEELMQSQDSPANN